MTCSVYPTHKCVGFSLSTSSRKPLGNIQPPHKCGGFDRRLPLIILVFLLASGIAFAAFPQPQGFVNDFAGILIDTQTLENTLATYEQNTTIEITVVTIEALPEDQTIETYAVELFQEWGIGKAEEDNGILVLIIKDGKPGGRLRIELGYGTQGYVTGAEAGRILDKALPYYEEGNYQTAVETILYELSIELENYVSGDPENYQSNEFDWAFWMFLLFNFFPFIFIFGYIAHGFWNLGRCPKCHSRKLICKSGHCICQVCGHSFKKYSRSAMIAAGFGAGAGHGGGGSFGGFGGGGSGGGGASR